MMYNELNIPFSREELLEKVKGKMGEKRFQHILGVEKSCIALSKKYGYSIEKASIAGLVHDYAKERNDEEVVAFIQNNNLDTTIIPYGNNIWHGVIGVYFIQEELGIMDEEILQAVRVHTTGSADMSLLDKILYVADFIEENRNFPGVEEARKLAFEDLDQAVAYETKHTLQYLLEREILIYPKTIETYNAYCVTK